MERTCCSGNTDDTIFLEQGHLGIVLRKKEEKYNLRKRKVWQESDEPQEKLEVERETWSQESVSLLRECYEDRKTDSGFPQLLTTCMESAIEIMDTESEDEGKGSWANTEFHNKRHENVQTDFSFFRDSKINRSNEDALRQTSFLASLIKLKVFLSTKKSTPPQTLSALVKNLWCKVKVEESELDEGNEISKETIGYLLRSADVDKVLEETVKGVVLYLSEELEKNLATVATWWKNSVYEEAVDATNRAVEWEPRLSGGIHIFLRTLVDSVLKNDDNLKSVALECKAIFIVNFCQSIHLSFFTITYAIRGLELLKSFKNGQDTSLLQKQSVAHLTKNSYYILRVLEALLVSFRAKLGEERTQFFDSKEKEESANVLEMWRKHWKCQEGARGVENDDWLKVAVAGWCTALDDLLLHCIRHVPLLSMPVERCSRLTKQVSNFCHKEFSEFTRKNARIAFPSP